MNQHRFDELNTAAPQAREFLLDRERLRFPASKLLTGDVRCVAVWGGAGTGKSALLENWADMLRGAGTPVIIIPGESSNIGISVFLEQEPCEFIVIVDNLHLASETTIAALLAWVERRPDARLVIAGRYLPGPGIAHLAARGLLLELRSTDLAFTLEECTALANARGVDLSEAAAQDLVVRTGGWATALALVLPMLVNGADPHRQIEHFVSDSRAIGDYLTSEVLEVCGEQEQELLLAATIDDETPTEIIVEITAVADGGAALDRLARRVMFLTVLDETVRFHPMLAQFLRAEARRRDLAETQRGHAIAARWFARHGNGRKALRHAAASADTGLLRETISAFAVDLILAGHGTPILDAIRTLPEPERGLPEHVAVLLMEIPFLDERTATHLFRLGESAVDEESDLQWCTLLHALRVLAGTDAADVDRHLRALSETDSLTARNRCFGLDLLCELAAGWYAGLDAEEETAMNTFRSVSDAAHRAGYTWLAFQASILATNSALANGNWAAAGAIEDTVVQRAQQLDNSPNLSAKAAAILVSAGSRYLRCLPIPQQELTDIIEADAAAGGVGLRMPARGVQLLEALDSAACAREAADEFDALMRASGRGTNQLLAGGLMRLTSIRLELDGRSAAGDFVRFAEPILGAASLEVHLARYLLDATTQGTDARERRLLEAVERGSVYWHPGAEPGAWILLAAHAQSQGRRLEADRRITAAVASAKRLRAVRPFAARNGEGAALLASRVGRLGHLESFASIVLERVEVPVELDSAAGSGAVHLTDREHDILRELPLHQTLAEIARRQHLSANTVKTHVRAIYQKLGVVERTAAVEVAREHGLL